MRGQFVRGDGLVIPNTVSLAGAQMLLTAALRNTVPTIYAALVKGFPTAGMLIDNLTEPTIGTNGYERIAISRDSTGWPTLSNLGSEAYIETDWLTWAASGGPFNQEVNRVCLIGTNTYTPTDPVYALSGPFEAFTTIDVPTDLDLRRFKYQLFI